MTRLSPALRPLWPYLRNGHRFAARINGSVFRPRRAADSSGSDRLPWTATSSLEETLAVEGDHIRLIEVDMPRTPVRVEPTGEPGGLHFWSEVIREPKDHAYVLEVCDGRLVGDFAATVTPGGRLQADVSPYFGRPWREHPIFLARRLPALQKIDGTLLSLSSPGSSANYYHSLMDVLPRWGLFQRAFPGVDPEAIVVGHASRWDKELQAMVGIDRHRLIAPPRRGGFQADRLAVPALGNRGALAPTWITQWLRDNLMSPDSPRHGRRIYVTRGNQPNSRRVVHEAELLQGLEKRGFESFDPGAHSVREQIDTFSAADVVVAPHGAGLVNLNFAPAGVRVLELFAPRYLNPAYWAITTNIEGSVYRYLVDDGGDPGRPEARMLGVQNDIGLSAERVLRAVDALLAR